MAKTPLSIPKWLPSAALAAAIAALVAPGAGRADSDDSSRAAPAYKLLTTIPVPGLNNFDTSTIDPNTGLVYISNRTNNALEVIDTQSNVLVKEVQKGNFGGLANGQAHSGPNGSAFLGHFLIVGDSPSQVDAIDVRNDQFVSKVNTGSPTGFRVEDLATNPRDNTVLATNADDSPPFVTLINVDPKTGALSAVMQIPFPEATSGIEQIAWDRDTDQFFVNIPEVNGNGDNTGATGEVVAINGKTGAINATFSIDTCEGTGIAVGPGNDLFIGCSITFNTAGVACDAPTATTPLDCHGLTGISKQVIIDKRNGSVLANVMGVSGDDQIKFNPGDQRYYTASRDNALGPVLGIIDGNRRALDQVVPTFNTSLLLPGRPAGSKSVTADAQRNRAFVALPGGPSVPNCLTGCVGVYGNSRSNP